MATYERALVRMTIAHKDQKRKFSGLPYAIHPIKVSGRVVDKISGKYTQDHINHHRVVAVLHDTVEDGHITITQVADEFGEAVARDVEALTRKRDETYEAFIDRLSTNAVAVVVKIADLEDNMSDLPDGHGLFKRYKPALEKLEKIATTNHWI